MRQQALRLASLLLLVALPTGCGVAAESPALRSPGLAQAHGAIATESTTKEAFGAYLRTKGIKLTDAELDVLVKERMLTPSGRFAARPAHNLSSEQNLEVHWLKHRNEFTPKPASGDEYMAMGIAAATGERGTVKFYFDTTSFQKGYQSHVVRWVPTTKDFTAFRADGDMTTYYRNNSVSLKRFIEVPEFK